MLTDAQLEQRRQATPRKHGLRGAFVREGGKGDESTLQPVQRERLAELREELRTRDGALSLLIERAARANLIAEMGEAYLREAAERGENIFQTDVLRRMGTFAAEARRCLTVLLPYYPEVSPIVSAETVRIAQLLDDDA